MPSPRGEEVRGELAAWALAIYEVAYLSSRDRWSWRRKGHPFWIDRPSYHTLREAHNAALRALRRDG